MIRLSVINGVWHARFADRTEGLVRELFGTDTLPTPYKANTPAHPSTQAGACYYELRKRRYVRPAT
jgi:hypothetical protein